MKDLLTTIAVAVALLFASGCTTLVVEKTAADGTITRVEYYSIGKDKSAEELIVPTSNGPASLKGGSSTVNPAVNDIAAAARNITEAAK